ncbi:hypothetical protein [Vibrio sp. SCSIO 43155]|uniref:hypothetical protein n=1 Tax=Vibrio sp. SCSIO 43155 TaxID=2819099 RepID=UPI0020765B02|nr:hypothetical protein [Vibrio sp. SCSIO 43155]USD58674.1 hypothetical protein J4N44_27360 [Vibrio sp. SCSIO 43155]
MNEFNVKLPELVNQSNYIDSKFVECLIADTFEHGYRPLLLITDDLLCYQIYRGNSTDSSDWIRTNTWKHAFLFDAFNSNNRNSYADSLNISYRKISMSKAFDVVEKFSDEVPVTCNSVKSMIENYVRKNRDEPLIPIYPNFFGDWRNHFAKQGATGMANYIQSFIDKSKNEW